MIEDQEMARIAKGNKRVFETEQSSRTSTEERILNP